MASDASKGKRNFYDEGPTASDVENEPNYFKIQSEEFAKELGRISARERMNKIKREAFSIPYPQYVSRNPAQYIGRLERNIWI